MKVIWTTEHELDFSDDYIDDVVDELREDGWNEEYVRECIQDEVRCYDDCDYYAWGEEQTEAVLNVIKQRLGGEQLRMELD